MSWVERFDEIGFGNQARIVGAKRVELKDFIRQLITQTQQDTLEWCLKEIKNFKVEFRFNAGIADKQYYKKQNADNKSDYRNAILDDLNQTIKKRMEEV